MFSIYFHPNQGACQERVVFTFTGIRQTKNKVETNYF